MSRAILLGVLLYLAPAAWARYGGEDPRLDKLFRTFVSPCCWREELTIHDSPTADQLRAQIRAMVQSGRSDEQIKNTLVQEHTKRVLVLPEGQQGTLLFLFPWLALGAGLGGVVYGVRRMLSRAPALSSDVSRSFVPGPPFDGDDDIF